MWWNFSKRHDSWHLLSWYELSVLNTWLVIAVCIAFQYSWSRSSQESLESILEEFLHTTWLMISHQGASHLFGALQTHQQRTYLECILIIYHLETLKEFVVLDCATQRFPCTVYTVDIGWNSCRILCKVSWVATFATSTVSPWSSGSPRCGTHWRILRHFSWPARTPCQPHRARRGIRKEACHNVKQWRKDIARQPRVPTHIARQPRNICDKLRHSNSRRPVSHFVLPDIKLSN